MRLIEEQMIEAIYSGNRWAKDNTIVSPIEGTHNVAVYLHGHEIATVNTNTDLVMVNKDTLYHWPTNTTKSRLRALGVNVYTKNYVTYLDDAEV